MKIVLFSYNASGAHTSLAVRALRTAVRDELPEVEVKIIEATIKEKRDFTLNSLFSEKAEIYGFSTYIWNVTETLSLAENLKILLPEAKIALGGPEVSFRAKEITERYGFVDTVITGEGEVGIVSLIRSYPKTPKIIKSPVDPQFTARPPHYFDKAPNGDLMPENLPAGKMIYYESSRGCPFHCSYCLSGDDGKVRAKSAKETLRDLKLLETLPGGERIVKLVDRTFNYDLARAKEIVSGLCSDDFHNRFHFEIQPALIDPEFVEILKNSPEGRFQLEIGIQSASEKVLRACGRGGNISKELENLRALKAETKVPIHADLIVGLPESEKADVIASVNEIYHACDELQLGFLKVLHGARMASDAGKYGMIFRSDPPYEILKTNTLSFEDIFLFKGVAHTLDRVSRSGKFRRGLVFILGNFKDDPAAKTKPYEFFEKLSLSLGSDPSAYSQSALYEKVFETGKSFCRTEDEILALKEALREDFSENERTRLPFALK